MVEVDFPRPSLPPTDLRVRVTAVESGPVFESIGRMVRDDLRRAARAVGAPLDAGERTVLDFGCGCGRVMRHFDHELASGVQLHGADVDPEAVAWCAENLANYGQFCTVDRKGRAPFADEMFDVIYAVSVFTHLMPEDQDHWLGELDRILDPSGFLLISVMGETALRLAAPDIAAQVAQKGWHFLYDGGTSGLPPWYQSCFHSEEYIRENWGKRFDIVRYMPGGICGSQDLVILQRLKENGSN